MSGKAYEVGHGKPPKGSRFKKGESGNPKGRPKGTRNFNTDLDQELRKKIRVREGGSEKIVSKQQAVVMALVAKAANGDSRAINTLVKAVDRLDANGGPESRDLTADEAEILGAFAAEIRERTLTGAPHESDDEEKTDD